jgi:Uma2 family endonuclease
MTTTTQPIFSQPVHPAEKRVTLHHVTWEAYQKILEALGEQRSALLTYYKGALEIMTPLEAHDNPSDLIGDFIKILVDEFDLKNVRYSEKISLLHQSISERS